MADGHHLDVSLPTLQLPMAEYEPPGTELIDEDTQEERRIPFARLAHAVRTFRILEPDNAQAVLDEAVREAESAGWWFDDDRDSACKNLDPGVANLILRVADRPREKWLRIGLHYDRGSGSEGRVFEPTCPLLNP